jgi:hypothetical protein
MGRNSGVKQIPKFPLIVSATHGDAVAINTVADYYRDYIRKLSAKHMFDEDGNVFSCIDEDMCRRLETKLITKILSFKPI